MDKSPSGLEQHEKIGWRRTCDGDAERVMKIRARSALRRPSELRGSHAASLIGLSVLTLGRGGLAEKRRSRGGAPSLQLAGRKDWWVGAVYGRTRGVMGFGVSGTRRRGRNGVPWIGSSLVGYGNGPLGRNSHRMFDPGPTSIQRVVGLISSRFELIWIVI
jgi:hypothetical protein